MVLNGFICEENTLAAPKLGKFLCISKIYKRYATFEYIIGKKLQNLSFWYLKQYHSLKTIRQIIYTIFCGRLKCLLFLENIEQNTSI